MKKLKASYSVNKTYAFKAEDSKMVFITFPTTSISVFVDRN
jgi:hypothetical protein